MMTGRVREKMEKSQRVNGKERSRGDRKDLEGRWKSARGEMEKSYSKEDGKELQ